MRNVLAYETARRLGRYAARTRFVEVRLNGRYHGVYVLMEKLKLQKRPDRPARARRSCWSGRSAGRCATKGRSFRLPITGYHILFEDPERADLGKRRRAGSAAASARPSARSTARLPRPARAGGATSTRRAAVDFLLVNELFKNQDAFRASTYLARGAGGRWQLGPVWDFDISMGNSDYGESAVLAGSMLEKRAWARAALPRPGASSPRSPRAGARCARGGLRRALLRERRPARAAARGDRRRRRATSAAGRCSASASGRTRLRRCGARPTRARCARCAPG